MNQTKKNRLGSAINKLSEFIIKCGGEGGTPGPCPTGNKPEGGGKVQANQSFIRPHGNPGISGENARRSMPAGSSRSGNEITFNGKGSGGLLLATETMKKFSSQGFKTDSIQHIPKGDLNPGMVITRMSHSDGHSVFSASEYGNSAGDRHDIVLKLAGT